MMGFTHEWHYTNPYRATIHGLPQGLDLCRPSKVAGGPSMENRLLRLLKSGAISVSILTSADFASRRRRALADGRYVPKVRKRRTDVGCPHARRKRYLWDREWPNTTEEVTEGMERDEVEYPVVERPKRMSNVERRRRAEREKERIERESEM